MKIRLKRTLGAYSGGTVLELKPATNKDGHPGDIVLCGVRDDILFPHLVAESGDLIPFAHIVGERRNIRYIAYQKADE
jgi:hypothetical protein